MAALVAAMAALLTAVLALAVAVVALTTARAAHQEARRRAAPKRQASHLLPPEPVLRTGKGGRRLLGYCKIRRGPPAQAVLRRAHRVASRTGRKA